MLCWELEYKEAGGMSLCLTLENYIYIQQEALTAYIMPQPGVQLFHNRLKLKGFRLLTLRQWNVG